MGTSSRSCSEGLIVREPIKKLSTMTKTAPVDIEFQDLTYSVRESGIRSGSKQILKSITGKFSSGEFTAILGPSGAGKSSLLHVLAGYVTAGVAGTIKINDRPRVMKLFHKISSYIMQEDLIQPKLTVQEYMLFSASLKLGSSITTEEKIRIVEEVLNVLGIKNCADSRTDNLSGGQRKRLSVALELVNNPPVIFLDEPTCGLDSVALKQCLHVLKALTRQGRTIVLTIHQPSTSIYELFDQVYFMADGLCVYNGSATETVPYLSSVGLTCPTTYNPADYIVELAKTDKDYVNVFSSATQNGKVNRRLRGKSYYPQSEYLDTNQNIYGVTTYTNDTNRNVNFPSTYTEQVRILLSRRFLQMRRNKTMLWTQFVHHTLSAMLLGGIFFGIGNDAAMVLSNFKFLVSVMVFFMYTHVMVPVLVFPLEVKTMQREFFNRWYGLKAYYTALTISSLPLLVILGCIFIVITYGMSDQPRNLDRFMLFGILCILIAITSEGLGLAVGSIFNITNGSTIASAVMTPLMALCVYGMGYGTKIAPFMKLLMSLSYLRFGIVGYCDAMYGGKRPPMDCSDEVYCHFRNPQLLMRDLGIINPSLTVQIVGLLMFTFLFRAIAFLALRYRMTKGFSDKVLNYATKIFSHD